MRRCAGSTSNVIFLGGLYFELLPWRFGFSHRAEVISTRTHPNASCLAERVQLDNIGVCPPQSQLTRPLVHREGAREGHVHSQVAVLTSAIQAHEATLRDGRPIGARRAAVRATTANGMAEQNTSIAQENRRKTAMRTRSTRVRKRRLNVDTAERLRPRPPQTCPRTTREQASTQLRKDGDPSTHELTRTTHKLGCYLPAGGPRTHLPPVSGVLSELLEPQLGFLCPPLSRGRAPPGLA